MFLLFLALRNAFLASKFNFIQPICSMRRLHNNWIRNFQFFTKKETFWKWCASKEFQKFPKHLSQRIFRWKKRWITATLLLSINIIRTFQNSLIVFVWYESIFSMHTEIVLRFCLTQNQLYLEALILSVCEYSLVEICYCSFHWKFCNCLTEWASERACVCVFKTV